MSPSSRYGSQNGHNMTPINRRKIQQNSGINNNLTPGSLVKLQQAYSQNHNGIHPLDVSSLGGASSGGFEPNGSHYHQFKRRSIGSEMYSPQLGSSNGYSNRRASEVAGSEQRSSGRDYFSQAVPNNSRMGSGIAPNAYPHTPLSSVNGPPSTHHFSERNDYNNPASRFLIN